MDNVKEMIDKILGGKDSLLWSIVRDCGYRLDDACIIKLQERNRNDRVLMLLKEAEDG